VRLPGGECRCQRCGHGWVGVGLRPPSSCASCKSRYWRTKRTRETPRPQFKAPAVEAEKGGE
jgi:hypothetical protein